MRFTWIALLSVTFLVGAALINPISERVGIVAFAASFEVVHVALHLVLYGSLMAVALRAGLSAAPAAAVTLLVAALQEGVQLVTSGRGPGWPEAFDILVDSVAIAMVLVATRKRRRVASS